MSRPSQKNSLICGISPASTTLLMDESLDSSKIMKYGIGLDVHKDSVAVCVKGQLPTTDIIQIHEHTFKNDAQGLKEMGKFLEKYPNAHYLMECTGVYHIPVHYLLQQMNPEHPECVIAMNPLLVHNRIADLGNKNDKADARTMASLAFYEDILRPSYVGSDAFYTLRENIRSYHRNLTQITRLYNRIHRHLHTVNQKFPFDLKSEWAIQLLDRYIAKDWTLGDAFNDLLKEELSAGRGGTLLKYASDVVRHAEICLGEERRFILQMDLMRLFQAQEAGALFLTRAESLILKDSEMISAYQSLNQITGVGTICSLTLLAELGDYSRFSDLAAFVKFCGVIPGINRSGNSIIKGHINRSTNKHIRYALCQAAGVLIGKKDQTTDLGAYAFKQYYLKHLPFKKAMLKVAHKLAEAAYNVLMNKYQYEPSHELIRQRTLKQQARIQKHGTLLESCQTRALRRNIQRFLVSNVEFMNSTSRYHLVTGFKRLITKSNRISKSENQKRSTTQIGQEEKK